MGNFKTNGDCLKVVHHDDPNFTGIESTVDTEKAVLAAILLEGKSMDECQNLLKEHCFSLEAHKKIFRAINDLYFHNKPIDIISVVNQLRKNSDIEFVGGASYIAKITTNVSSSLHIMHHIQILIDASIKRRIRRELGGIISEINIATDGLALLKECERTLTNIQGVIVAPNLEYGDQLFSEYLKESKIEKPQGLNTGILSLNSLVDPEYKSGWQKGSLNVVAAGTGEGKSAFMINSAIDTFKDDRRDGGVIFFSIEMEGKALMNRIVSRELARSGLDRYEKPINTISDSKKIEAMSWIDDSFIVDSSPELNTLKIYTKCRTIMRKHGLKAVFVDYSQRVDSSSRNFNREQDVRDVAKFLKSLARELDVSVITGAQINRNITARIKGDTPKISDLRESDALGHEADTVLFLQKPADDKNYAEDYVDLFLIKNRNGNTGKVPLIFNRRMQHFKEFDNGEDIFL